jgi:4-carboxymuconolactone decarboxylase
MQLLAALITLLSLIAASSAHADQTSAAPSAKPMVTLDHVRKVAPALEKSTPGTLLGDLWKRPDLSPRDRSLMTVAALIARHQTIEMPSSINLALDNGVKPSEMSEVITHLAFSVGWPNAFSALPVAKGVFEKRPGRSLCNQQGGLCTWTSKAAVHSRLTSI